MAGERQYNPSVVDIVFPDERLGKSTVTDDRAKPVSSFLARARTSTIATAAVTAKATLDDSVKRAYVKIARKRRSPRLCATIPCLL